MAPSAPKPHNFWDGLGSFQKRLISAVILGAVVLAMIFLGGWFFNVLIIIMSLIAFEEFRGLIKHRSHQKLWIAGGAVYIVVPALSLIWLRQQGQAPYDWLPVLLCMVTVWATDSFAYFSGRSLGGPKLAPSVSPSKTWSGLLGGMLGAAIVLGGIAWYFHLHSWPVYAGLGAVLALIAQLGDLFESHLKRRAGVKDSGTLIPGHGGVLDRIDGLLTAAPCFAVFMWFFA